MAFQYTKLPYKNNALEPHILAETMIFHHDKHYKKYVITLNALMAHSNMVEQSLEDVMMKTHGVDDEIFQNAAQVWNHEFYFKCLSPEKTKSSKWVREILEENFGSLQQFEDEFKQTALNLFGSGWVWVVRGPYGAVEIKALEKAENPITSGLAPLLVCDVWEHAYYLDYQNDRAKYVNHFWQILNWSFFEQNIRDSIPIREHLHIRGIDEIYDGI